MNLRHRKIEEQTDDTLKCNQCEQQILAQWNLKNHIRDNHEKITYCKYFKQGSCCFPENVCWNRHQHPTSPSKGTNLQEGEECYVCKTKFKRKHDMMLHRKENHPEKVRPCNYNENGQFQNCWYLHSEKKCEEQETEHSQNRNEPEEVQSDNKSESVQSKVTPQDFQNVNTNPKTN